MTQWLSSSLHRFVIISLTTLMHSLVQVHPEQHAAALWQFQWAPVPAQMVMSCVLLLWGLVLLQELE